MDTPEAIVSNLYQLAEIRELYEEVSVSDVKFSYRLHSNTFLLCYIAKCSLATACYPSCLVSPSVGLSDSVLVDCDHIGWKSWKLMVRTINPTPSLFVIM